MRKQCRRSHGGLWKHLAQLPHNEASPPAPGAEGPFHDSESGPAVSEITSGCDRDHQPTERNSSGSRKHALAAKELPSLSGELIDQLC